MSEDSEQAELARAVDRLVKRLDRLGRSGWVPGWLKAVGSREDLAEFRAINRTYHGPSYYEYNLEFIKKMRAKHPEMPLSFEEEMERGAQRLKANPELARREGLSEEEIQESRNDMFKDLVDRFEHLDRLPRDRFSGPQLAARIRRMLKLISTPRIGDFLESEDIHHIETAAGKAETKEYATMAKYVSSLTDDERSACANLIHDYEGRGFGLSEEGIQD